MPDLNCFTIESAMKMVAGTARSMGFSVKVQHPGITNSIRFKIIYSEIDQEQKKAEGLVEQNKLYSIEEAAQLVKQTNTAKFNASVDLHIRLGIDPRKADQAIRGTTALPHGTGKDKSVLVLCTPDKEDEAKSGRCRLRRSG